MPTSPLLQPGLWPRALRAVAGTGVLAPVRPDRLVRMAAALRLGPGIATECAVGAARHPDRTAVADDRGTITYADLNDRAAAIAAGLRDEFGVGRERPLAVMCRNHRGFVEAMAAGSRLGADVLLLNTDFPAPQLAEVLETERPGAAVFDDEFTPAFDEAGFDGARVLAWDDDGGDHATLDGLAERRPGRVPGSLKQGRLVVLTSGTTGTPKGAPREPSLGAMVGPVTTLLSRVPLRAGEPMLIAPPFFHGFGLAYLGLGLGLGSTIVTQRRFDPDAALDAIERHGVTAIVAVPVMFQRMLALDAAGRSRADSLRVAISAAAPLSPALAEEIMDAFGDVLYNLYGSTETGFGAIATPDDLRTAPGTVGRPPYGTELRILDEERREVERGDVGTIFLGGPLVFEGYSAGGSKETVDGLMSTGDRGHLDSDGRLFIDGRDDDMIVSGGENVFPQEVEDVLRRHGDVADAAVVGVEDEDFGQRLRAFVVPRDGADPSEHDLKTHVKEQLARYKVPREVVTVDEIPRNPTGKLLKRELPEPTS